MNRIAYARFVGLVTLMLVFLYSVSVTQAQTTSFTYQGRLTDSSLPASPSYDFQFVLFDAAAGGNQVATNSLPTNNVSVSNGIFSVTLDFGPAFPGTNRFLEIRVRSAGGGAFTTLTPRQPITSTPYAIKSLNATTADGLSVACVGCVTSSQIGSLPTGNGSYIQNSTSQQANANFNISGNGVIGGNVGIGALVPGTDFSVVKDRSDGFTISSFRNSSRSGYAAIAINTPSTAGGAGFILAYYGDQWAGQGDATNPLAGATLFSASAVSTKFIFNPGPGGDYRFDIGSSEKVRIDNAGNVGIGTTSPQTRLHVDYNANAYTAILSGGTNSGILFRSPFWTNNGTAGTAYILAGDDGGQGGNLIFGTTASGSGVNGTPTERMRILANGNVGIGTTNPGSFKLEIEGSIGPGTDAAHSLGAPSRRWNTVFASNGVVTTSDARLKKSVNNLGYGLSHLMQLRPVSFEWKDRSDGRTYLGLIAQEVEKIIPEAIERDKDPATPLGMSYTSLVPVLIKAVQEQQEQIKQQRVEIEQLKQLLCAQQPTVPVCQTPKP